MVAADEIKEEILEIVSYLNNRMDYELIGAKMPKGYLFFGPPGTGKSYAAKVLASETDYNFVAVSGSQLQSSYVGGAKENIEKMFEFARNHLPCILFIDEIDSIGGKRNNIYNMNDGSLNKLLSEMDGFMDNEEIIVIGCTNMKDTLDSALIRPGRFDKIFHFTYPDP